MSDTDSINSFNSWASNVTTCEPLGKVLSSFNNNTKFERKVFEIITSLRNSVLKNGGSEKPTEFYAAMISFLKETEIDIASMEACIYILKHLMRQSIPNTVLRYTTSDLSKIILSLFSGSYSKNELIVKSGLFCMAKLLAAQTDDNWKLDNIIHLYRTLFSYTTDSRKTINKDARKSVLLIFSSKTKTSGLLSKKHPLNRETIAILTNLTKTQNAVNKKRNNLDARVKPSPEDDRLSFSLTTLSVLLQSKLFNTECVIVYLETLIQCLLSMQIVPIQCQILNIFSDIFIRRVLFPEQVARSITSLFAYLATICDGKQQASPSIPPSFLGTSWLNTVLMGFEALLLSDQSTFLDSTTNQTMDSRIVALTHATQLVKICGDWLKCDCDELSQSAFVTLSKLCTGSMTTNEHGVDDSLSQDRHADTDNWLVKWGETLRRLLLLGCSNTKLWTRVIECLTQLVIRSAGKCAQFGDLLVKVLPQVAELRDSYEDTEEEAIADLVKDKHEGLSATERVSKNTAEEFIGNSIKMYGLGTVSRALPLADVAQLSSTRTWLLPLVNMYAESTDLDQFRILILPLIQLVSRHMDDISSRQQQSTDDQMETDSAPVVPSQAVVTLGMLRYQLWSCLPSFAKRVVAGGLRSVSNHCIEPSQQPNAFPAGCEPTTNSGTLWQLLLDLLTPSDTESSHLETVVLMTVRNIVTTAQDKDEMREVLTSSALFPQLLQRIFSLYLHQQHCRDRSISANITTTLGVYLPLFEPATFDANCAFLINKKLADVDRAAPTEAQLLCVDLLLMLGPHLSEESIGTTGAFLSRYLDSTDGEAHGALQKRAYRFLQLITASNTDTSNAYTKRNLKSILVQLHAWKSTVKNDSWKCRMKCLYNLFKLLSERAEIVDLLNGFLSEIIGCLNMSNKKARVMAGALLVEAVLGSSDPDNEEQSISVSINAMIKRIISCIRDSMDDNSARGVQYKGALAKALYLIVRESRLSRFVTRHHILDSMAIATDIFSRASAKVGENRNLVYCALDFLKGLLKKETANFDNIYLVDVGNCISATSAELRLKVRTPMKRILKKMLQLWEYENIKKCIPGDLVAVLRNIHKSMNRSKRHDKDKSDTASMATSWAGDMASQQTMKNPHIKNIADLLHDTDSEDDDLQTRVTATTMGNKSTKSAKSTKSTVSRANELRQLRKRKIDSANATLHLEENLDDIVDVSDQTSILRHLRISDGKDRRVLHATAPTDKAPAKTVDKRGFHFEAGRLVIGKVEEQKEVANKPADKDDDSENENYKSEKERFQPVKKRQRREKLPGSEYKARKKGTFGDMKSNDKPDPYAYIPFKSADQCHSVMKKYQKDTKKAHKMARQMSKVRNMNRKKKQ